MAKQIVLLSGGVSAGKTTLSSELQAQFGFSVLKTKEVICQLAAKKLRREIEPTRRALQQFGQKLDRETSGKWVRDALTKSLRRNDGPRHRIVVDAVRILDQVRAIRQAYGFSVVHIHLSAPEEVLAERYNNRVTSGIRELSSYQAVRRNKTEEKVSELEAAADVVIDTARCRPEDVLVRAATHLDLYSREYGRCVDVIVGGQYGSEGKGHIASYLARDYSLLVRVGGPNAGHKVYMSPDPYTHHQLPSGTLRNPEAKLVLAPGCVLNSDDLIGEIAECKVDREKLSIDPQAMIISDRDIENEKALVKGIGSTGQGVGYATARRLTDRAKGVKLARDFKVLRPYVRETWPILEQAYKDNALVMVEGTQGAGLSLYHGSYPYVTSRDTSVSGCIAEAGISPSRVRRVIMVCRTYPIRVQDPPGGTSGPMGKEINLKIVSERSKLPLQQLQKTEITSTTHRKRRIAEFNWELLRRASALNGPTDIALTFADYLNSQNANARRFEQLDKETIHFIEEVERVAAAPVSLISTRFDFRGIIDRRSW